MNRAEIKIENQPGNVHDRIRQAREDKILQQEFEREMLIDQMIFISDFEQNKV
jgi:hypothetical protein